MPQGPPHGIGFCMYQAAVSADSSVPVLSSSPMSLRYHAAQQSSSAEVGTLASAWGA